MIIPNIWENKKWQPNHQPAGWFQGQHELLRALLVELLGFALNLLLRGSEQRQLRGAVQPGLKMEVWENLWFDMIQLRET